MFTKTFTTNTLATTIEAPTALSTIGAGKHDANLIFNQSTLGKHFQAEVLSILKDGNYIVKLGSITARMMLPNNPKIGDKLDLTLVSFAPRPSFLLDGKDKITISEPNLRQALIEELINKSPKPGTRSTDFADKISRTNDTKIDSSLNHAYRTMQADASRVDSDSVQADLSPTAMLINKILTETSSTKTLTGLIGKEPLLAPEKVLYNKAAIPKHLSTALQDAIENSGLFYESHLAKYLNGQLTLEQLQKEPQSKIALSLEQTVLNNSKESGHAELANLVHQQLDVSEQKQIVWNGQLFTGAPLVLSVTEDQQQAENPTENTSPPISWVSQLQLELPHLGKISASIRLTGNHVQIALKASESETLSTLKSHAAELSKGIANSGNQLDSLTASHDELI